MSTGELGGEPVDLALVLVTLEPADHVVEAAAGVDLAQIGRTLELELD